MPPDCGLPALALRAIRDFPPAVFTVIYCHRIFAMLRDRAHTRFFAARTNTLLLRKFEHVSASTQNI
jgi:hypothetical protein